MREKQRYLQMKTEFATKRSSLKEFPMIYSRKEEKNSRKNV